MIVLIIYLIGIPVSYLFGRYCIKKRHESYTLADRVYNMFYALFSWVSCLAILLIFNDCIFNIDEEAKW